MMKNMLISCFLVFMLLTPVIAEEEPGLQVGTMAPDFEAVTHDGKQVKFSDINAQGPVVLVFYRGGWCMYCNMQLQALQSRLDDFKNLGASIVAISVDLQDNATKSVEEKQLGFTVISDPQAKLLQQYNLIYKVPDDLAKQYKEEYNIDLEAASGRRNHVIAIPATYIIDKNGTITFAYANRDYKVRMSADELLNALAQVATQ